MICGPRFGCAFGLSFILEGELPKMLSCLFVLSDFVIKCLLFIVQIWRKGCCHFVLALFIKFCIKGFVKIMEMRT